MSRIRNLDDMQRANIVMAWTLLAHSMTHAQYDELCRVTRAYFPDGPPAAQVLAQEAA